ncbi:hypothetical protein EHQ43_17525 [Leptospira bouyouniensis]|uniref:Uncharacterized protein n=1 Tax=Leptospira bouyouniensis TaxID=2484911 RepID=A0A7I0HQ08_9LEPT|nr:hypothetical protein [Leptospira bouyouniensis]TGL03553.1 hypothetical protein EHQ43_17525 [Leptospira bouyouniensis]
MNYIEVQDQSKNYVKFSMRSIDRTHIPVLINQLAQYYLIHCFINFVNQMNKANSDYFLHEIEEKRIGEFVDQLTSNFEDIKLLSEISFEELIIQFPELGKELIRQYSDLERANISMCFGKVVKALAVQDNSR